MSTANWTIEQFKKKLRGCIIPLMATNGPAVNINDITRDFEKLQGVFPPVEQFGFNNLSTFLDNFPDEFTKMNGCWAVIKSSFTDSEKENFRQISCSNKGRGASRGGRGASRGGRGASRGGGTYGAAFRPRVAASTRGGSFTNSGGSGGLPNESTNRVNIDLGFNGGNLGFGNSSGENLSRGNTINFSRGNENFNQFNRNDYNDGISRRSDESTAFNKINDGYTAYDNMERYNDGNYPRDDIYNNSYHQGFNRLSYEDKYNQRPPPASFGSPPPGFSVSPPPGLNMSALPDPRIYGASSVASSRKSHSDLIVEMIKILHHNWPNSMKAIEVLKKTQFQFSDNSQQLNELLNKIKEKIECKYKDFIYFDESEAKMIYRIGHPEGTEVELRELLTRIVATYLKVRAPGRTIENMAEELGIEDRGGGHKCSFLWQCLQFHPDFNTIFEYVGKGKDRFFSLKSNARFTPWNPPPINFEGKKVQRSVPCLTPSRNANTPTNNAMTAPDNNTITWDTFTPSGSTAFRPRQLPLSSILYGTKNIKQGSFEAIVSNYIDYGCFYIRNEADQYEYEKLRDTMRAYYGSLSDRLSLQQIQIRENQLVAFYHAKSKLYYRGCIKETSGLNSRIFAIDVGFTELISNIYVYPLTEDFRGFDPLATRCSLGDFSILDMEQLIKKEDELVQYCTQKNPDIDIIDKEDGYCLIVDLTIDDIQYPQKFMAERLIEAVNNIKEKYQY